MQNKQIILKPIISEKTLKDEVLGKYTFKVLATANKIEVAKAVKEIFGTKVLSVNIANTKDKNRRRGKTRGIVSGFRKAIVTLAKGEKIKMREEKKEEKKKITKKDADEAIKKQEKEKE